MEFLFIEMNGFLKPVSQPEAASFRDISGVCICTNIVLRIKGFYNYFNNQPAALRSEAGFFEIQ
jgi:hypothetical protein